MIVGQDAGDVPVSGGQRLKDVCARVRLEDSEGPLNTLYQTFNTDIIRVFHYHSGGHRDVEELSSPTLRDCSGEEEFVSVVGEERSFILQRGWKNICMCPKTCLLGFCISCLQAQTHKVKTTHDHRGTMFPSRTCLCNQLSLSSSCFCITNKTTRV